MALAADRIRLLDEAGRLERAAAALHAAADAIGGSFRQLEANVASVHGHCGGWMGPAADQYWTDVQVEFGRARAEQSTLYALADQLRSRAAALRHQAGY